MVSHELQLLQRLRLALQKGSCIWRMQPGAKHCKDTLPRATILQRSAGWPPAHEHGRQDTPVGADVAAQALHVGQEVQMADGQALILQEHHRADVHGVRQEGRRCHDAACVLHRRQRLRALHSSCSAQNTACKTCLGAAQRVASANQALLPQCTADALPAWLTAHQDMRPASCLAGYAIKAMETMPAKEGAAANMHCAESAPAVQSACSRCQAGGVKR